MDTADYSNEDFNTHARDVIIEESFSLATLSEGSLEVSNSEGSIGASRTTQGGAAGRRPVGRVSRNPNEGLAVVGDDIFDAEEERNLSRLPPGILVR